MVLLGTVWRRIHLMAGRASLVWCQVVLCDEGLQERLLGHGSLGQWALPERVLRKLLPPNTGGRILVQQARDEILKGRADIWT